MKPKIDMEFVVTCLYSSLFLTSRVREMKSARNRQEDANRTLSTKTVFGAHIADMCAWLQTQVLSLSHVPQNSFVIIIPSCLYQILHQDTHVTPRDAHVPQELLAEHALRELTVVNQQLLAHPSKPLEKLGAFAEPRNHVGRHEQGR